MNKVEATHTQITGFDNYELCVSVWEPQTPVATTVLVHGVVSHAQWLEDIGRGLCHRGIRCIAPDRRGSGRNTAARGDAPDKRALIDDLQRVIAHFHRDSLPLHLCGFCWGANYTVHYALENQSQLTSLCLIAPSLFPSERLRQMPLHTGDSGQATEPPVTPIELFTAGPKYREFILPDPLRLRAVSPRFNAVSQQMSSMIGLKLLKQTLPTLMLLADGDEMVDNDATEKIFTRLKSPRKQLIYLPGAHGIQFDAPDQVVARLAEWAGSFPRDETKESNDGR